MSEDPLTFFTGDTNSYRYVISNPLRFKDPSGLILQYGCDQARKEFEDDIARIRSTYEGAKLLEMLESSPTVFTIHLSFIRELRRNGNNIFIDANVNPLILTNEGPKEASTTRILAHELGHLTGVRDKGVKEMDKHVSLGESNYASN